MVFRFYICATIKMTTDKRTLDAPWNLEAPTVRENSVDELKINGNSDFTIRTLSVGSNTPPRKLGGHGDIGKSYYLV